MLHHALTVECPTFAILRSHAVRLRYKGPAGMIDSGIGGFVFGAVYLLSGRNLWPAILAHGFIDTLGIVLLYLGLAS